MLTLEEARTIQAKRQKTAIIKFSVYLGLISIVFVCITLLTDYLVSYPVLYVLFAGAIVIAAIRSKIHKFLQKRNSPALLCNQISTSVPSKQICHIKRDKGRGLSMCLC